MHTCYIYYYYNGLTSKSSKYKYFGFGAVSWYPSEGRLHLRLYVNPILPRY